MSAPIKLSSPETREFWEIPVLFEDDHLLAIDKPSRLLSCPDRYDPARPNLMGLLHRDIKRGAPWAAQRNTTYLANAHRLDFETSGILLLAKNKPALVHLANQFGSEKPVKTYIALVHGLPPEPKFECSQPLAPHPARPGLMRIDSKHGKKSRTLFEVIETFRSHALLACTPLTGRTHQIRVHLKAAGFSLVGDALYGGGLLLLSHLKADYRLKKDREERPLLARVALHATRLTVRHPATESPVTIESAWPKDLTVAVKYLRKFRA